MCGGSIFKRCVEGTGEWTVLPLQGQLQTSAFPNARDGTGAGQGMFPGGVGATHRGMLPVQDNLGDVFHRVQKVVVSPLVPVDGHRAVLIHAARQTYGGSYVNRLKPSAAPLRHGHQEHQNPLCVKKECDGPQGLHWLGIAWRGGRQLPGWHRYLLGDRAPEVARSYSDRQTNDAEERGETQISVPSEC